MSVFVSTGLKWKPLCCCYLYGGVSCLPWCC